MSEPTKLPRIILKKGREKAVKNFHYWIFSGAIETFDPEIQDGGFVEVYSMADEFLGTAYFKKSTSIAARMITFDRTPPEIAISQRIQSAIALRRTFIDESVTNAYRLINSEGDGLPGLTVDKYDKLLVVQISTLGMERLKGLVMDLLISAMSPASIFEKSDVGIRSEEGLAPKQGLLWGEVMDRVTIKENGLAFVVDMKTAQKTGLYLDQREMRQLAGTFAQGRKALNCFSYTGGFSVYAAMGGAERVDSVDLSTPAMELARENFRLNQIDESPHRFIVADVFDFLRKEQETYGFIILDPPAFAKKRLDVVAACRGYKDINRLALKKIQTPGILMTSSCSHHVDEKLFQQVIFEAAVEASRNARIIRRHHLAMDHPVSVFHPEGAYLKSLVLYVE